MTTATLKEQLQIFFPAEVFINDELTESLEKGEILTRDSDILPYLQTALLDEKVVEIELNGTPQVYFSRLKDDNPKLIEEEQGNGEIELVEPEDYKEGDYLTEMTHIITLPLEPGLGNLHLRNSQTILVRMFTNTFGVELCTTFDSLTKVRDLPVLRLNYPSIARIVRNAREFRAKVPEKMEFIADIELDEEGNSIDTNVVNISIKGLAFSYAKDERSLFTLGQTYRLKLFIDDQLMANVSGKIIHLSKVRKRFGIEYVGGVLFDMDTKTVTSAIESIVASVQRAHLQELAEKSEVSGIDLIA